MYPLLKTAHERDDRLLLKAYRHVNPYSACSFLILQDVYYQIGHHFICETFSWKGAYYYTSHCLPFGEGTDEHLRCFGASLENIYDPEGYGAPFFTTLEDAFNFCNYYAANRNLLGGIEEEDVTRNLDTGEWELVQQRKATT